MRIEAVTLDAFGTVLDTGRTAVLEVVAEVVVRERLAMSPETFLAAWDDAFFGLQAAGRMSTARFLTLAETSQRSLGSTLARFGSKGEARPYVESLLARWRRARPFPDARGALERLRGTPLAIVSNADDAFLRDLMDRCSLPVDLVITSEATRSYKPDRGIFEAALAALGTPAERTLHIGDSYLEDVVGSKGAGMAAAWLNRRGLPRPRDGPSPDYEVRDLGSIPGLLGNPAGVHTRKRREVMRVRRRAHRNR